MVEPGGPAPVAPLRFAGLALEARIGLGGSADVWRGVDGEGRAIACKRLMPHLRADRDARLRLAREANALQALAGAAVPTWIAGDVDADVPWIATALVSGPTWKQLRGASSAVRALAVQGLWRALATLHSRGWLHGDLAPGNVAVDADGRTVLLDLGLSRSVALSAQGDDDLAYPTPAFASPEVARGQRAASASDVFAAASLSHWLLVGASPVPERAGAALRAALASDPPAIAPRAEALTAALDTDGAALLRRCWASRPMERPSVAEVLARLGPIVDCRVGASDPDALRQAARDHAPRLGALPVQAAEDRAEVVTGDDDAGAARALVE